MVEISAALHPANLTERQKNVEQAGATNRLPAAIWERHDTHDLNLELEGALPVACGRPWTLCEKIAYA